MQLSVSNFEAGLIKKALASSTLADNLLEKIKSAEDEQANKKSCEHVPGVYYGKRECCTKCGCFSEGNGENWMLYEGKE